jgi:hypothetical protein
MISQPKLTDTQLILLSAAAQCEDGILVQPSRLKGGAAQAVTGPLLSSGYIEEVQVGAHDSYWKTADDGSYLGFRITSAGFKAIGLETAADGDNAEQASGDPNLRACLRSIDLPLCVAMRLGYVQPCF